MANQCVTTRLEPYIPNTQRPWNKERVQHLFLRAGFGLSPDEITNYLSWSPVDLVDHLIDEAVSMPLREKPEWAEWALSDYEDQQQAVQQIFEWVRWWLTDMVELGLREKMALFWHNHFVTEIDSYFCPSYLYAYLNILQENALGNFKDLTVAAGKTPAMLIYLNGVQNNRFNPNENYARELLELFTLGRDVNYTQEDITEIARALTGWNGFSEACASIDFIPFFHDSGSKTIFGKTDSYDYQGLHDLLFEERKEEIAEHICRKIHRFFVGPEVVEEVVEEMKSIFLASEFEIAPVLRALFKSEYFFDEQQLGTCIISPVEMLLGLAKRTGFQLREADYQIIYGIGGQLGQRLLNPPDVAGWPGDRNWLNSSFMALRWSVLEGLTGLIYNRNRDLFGTFTRNATSAFDNVELVCRDVIHHFMPWGLPFPADYEAALDAFKIEIPQNYFDDGLWNTDWDTLSDQTASLLAHLIRLPEFQLS